MYTGHKFRVETFYRHVQHDNVLRVAVTAKTGELVFVESVYQEVEFDWYGLPPIKEDMKASLMLLVG